MTNRVRRYILVTSGEILGVKDWQAATGSGTLMRRGRRVRSVDQYGCAERHRAVGLDVVSNRYRTVKTG